MYMFLFIDEARPTFCCPPRLASQRVVPQHLMRPWTKGHVSRVFSIVKTCIDHVYCFSQIIRADTVVVCLFGWVGLGWVVVWCVVCGVWCVLCCVLCVVCGVVWCGVVLCCVCFFIFV